MEAYMRTEALPTLQPISGVDFTEYVASTVWRFQDPAIKDTLARICSCTSNRIPKFLFPVDDERFSSVYLAALESLLTQGAHETTRRLLAEG